MNFRCTHCNRPWKNKTCRNCIKHQLYEDGYFGDQAVKIALMDIYVVPEFFDACPEHGWTEHSPQTRLCWTCEPNQPNALERAKLRREPTYWATCQAHGTSVHTVRGERCSECFTSAGSPRIVNIARAEARKEGRPSWLGECAVHGPDTPHSTGPGKCLTCFNSQGYPRPAFRCDPT